VFARLLLFVQRLFWECGKLQRLLVRMVAMGLCALVVVGVLCVLTSWSAMNKWSFSVAA